MTTLRTDSGTSFENCSSNLPAYPYHRVKIYDAYVPFRSYN